MTIDCREFVSERELVEKVRGFESYSSTVVFVKGVEWMLEVGG